MKIHRHTMFRTISMAILTAALTLTIGFEASAKPNKALIKEAAAAYEKGNYDVALDKFQQAYREDTTQTSLLYNIGRVYESKAEYANAIEYYKQFLAVAGSDEDARDDALDRIKKCNEILDAIGGSKKASKAAKAAAAGGADSNAGGGKKGGAKAAAALPAGGCIDINKASVDELTALNGIGPASAKNIVASRDAEGPFKSVDDITRVNKIGEKTLAKFRDQVCPIAGGAAPAAAAPAPAAAAPAKKAPKAKDNAPAAAPKVKPVNAGTVMDI